MGMRQLRPPRFTRPGCFGFPHPLVTADLASRTVPGEHPGVLGVGPELREVPVGREEEAGWVRCPDSVVRRET